MSGATGAGFRLPDVPPDFALMARPALEDYAAELDFCLRDILGAPDDLAFDLERFFAFGYQKGFYPDAYRRSALPGRMRLLAAMALRPREFLRHSHLRLTAQPPVERFPMIVDAKPASNLTRVYVCNLRPLCRVHDLEIRNSPGFGYGLFGAVEAFLKEVKDFKLTGFRSAPPAQKQAVAA